MGIRSILLLSTDVGRSTSMVLLTAGMAADILVDFSNPDAWMLHSHIVEHMEAGMHTMVHAR